MLLLSQSNVYKYNKDYMKQNKTITYVALIKPNIPISKNFEGNYVTIGIYYHIL